MVEDFQHGGCLQLEEGQTRVVTHVDGNYAALAQGVLELAVEVAVCQVGGCVHAGEDVEDNRIEAGHAQQFRQVRQLLAGIPDHQPTVGTCG